MEMIGLDLCVETYVVLKNQKVICTENTVDYIEQQMMREGEEDIILTVASWVKDITILVKKVDIDNYFTEGKNALEIMSKRTE